MDTVVRINPSTGSGLRLSCSTEIQVINLISLNEKMTIHAVFPFCRALCEIPVSILTRWTDSAVFNKHLKKLFDFSDLAINK